MPKPDQRELAFIADRLVEKVWQNDEAKRGLATQCAGVALAAIQDFTEQLYMETADQFSGLDVDLRRVWLMQEARASVALDGETVAVGPVTVGEVDVSTERQP